MANNANFKVGDYVFYAGNEFTAPDHGVVEFIDYEEVWVKWDSDGSCLWVYDSDIVLVDCKSDCQNTQNTANELTEFAKIAERLLDPVGRKYCLNFAYANGFEVNGNKLRTLFDPEKFMCKITPIHMNNSCRENNIETIDGYCSYHPYKLPEQSLKSAGFDVLVFIPSKDEEDGIVTCGNAILGGSTIKVVSDSVKISGVK